MLLDVRMPGPSGLDLQAALRERGIALPVIFLTGHGDVSTSVRAMKTGAVDFLTKPVERETLFEALHRALALDASGRASRDGGDELRARFASLTPREREVFDLVVAGRLNKQIAGAAGDRRAHRQGAIAPRSWPSWASARRPSSAPWPSACASCRATARAGA